MSIHQNNKASKKQIFLKGLMALFLVSTLVLGITLSIVLKPGGKRNSQGYDITNIVDVQRRRPIPADRLLYDQKHEIQLPMEQPRAVAIGLEDKIYVAGDKVVLVFNRHGERLSELTVNDTATAVATGKDGRVYIGVQEHVEVFNQEGTRLSSWPSLNTTAFITSIAVSEEVFIRDFVNQCIWRCDIEGSVQERITRGEEDRRLRFCPCISTVDVATDLGGHLWLSDHKNFQVKQYRPDGTLMQQWGKRAYSLDGFCMPCNPTHLAVGPSGRIFTSEQILERVKVYEADGQFLGIVVGPSDFAKGTEGLDLAVNSKGDVLVLDPARKTIHVYVENG